MIQLLTHSSLTNTGSLFIPIKSRLLSVSRHHTKITASSIMDDNLFFSSCIFTVLLAFVQAHQLPPDVTSMADFVQHVRMKDGSRLNITEYLASSDFRQSVAGQMIDDAPMANYDACTPRLTKFECEKHPNPLFSYFPPCTRALRCGGCVPGLVQECTAVETDYTPRTVMVTRIPEAGFSDFIFEGFEVINIPQHIRCEPRCRVTQEHCNDLQDYLPHDCRCVCRERNPCLTDRHRWDEASCSCKCTEENIRCPRFAVFDTDKCECDLRPGLKVYQDRQGVSVEVTREELQQMRDDPPPTSTTTTPTTTLPQLQFNIAGSPCQLPPNSLFCLPGMSPRWSQNGECICMPNGNFRLPTLGRRRRNALVRRLMKMNR